MSSFFLGGSIKVKEIENIANTYSEFEEVILKFLIMFF